MRASPLHEGYSRALPSPGTCWMPFTRLPVPRGAWKGLVPPLGVPSCGLGGTLPPDSLCRASWLPLRRAPAPLGSGAPQHPALASAFVFPRPVSPRLVKKLCFSWWTVICFSGVHFSPLLLLETEEREFSRNEVQIFILPGNVEVFPHFPSLFCSGLGEIKPLDTPAWVLSPP